MHKQLLFLAMLLVTIVGCQRQNTQDNNISSKYRSMGSIEVYDSVLADILSPKATIEVLADGFDWSEGPEWVEKGDFLLFTDIKPNTIYRWSEEDSITVYLSPSGYTDTIPREGEVGANGLMLNAAGKLILCQHGDRRLALMDAPLNAPLPNFVPITSVYNSMRYNSPNDLIIRSNGDIFFTDPPYGLEKGVKDPAKEIPYQGVFKWSAADSSVQLVDSLMTRPNGIVLSPDEKKLYVANSDPDKALWNEYVIHDNDSISEPRVLIDATSSVKDHPGLPDGMVMHPSGLLFATAPGGVWVITKEGTVVGKIFTNQPTANCTFDDDHESLYITSDNLLLRVKMKKQQR